MSTDDGIALARVLDATRGVVLGGGDAVADVRFSSVSIDTRRIDKGALFFAIKGPRFDGHDFLDAARKAGALGAVVQKDQAKSRPAGLILIEVDDPTAALGKLGAAHRDDLAGLRVVGVTGSNGKTTTKDMIAAILAAHGGAAAVKKTEGNLNNHLGVPLTLLGLGKEHRFAVVEMGMSALGEIRYLTKMARPDVAVIVNIAGVHLETLGSLDNVARAKSEIYEGLGKNGVAVRPIDEPRLEQRVPSELKQLTFGPSMAGPDVAYVDPKSSTEGTTFTLRIKGDAYVVRMPLVGTHTAIDAAAAAAVATALGVPPTTIVDGLASVRPAKHRAELMRVGALTVLDDCYNASPLSMRAALDALTTLAPVEHRVAVLGDMLELGTDSEALHAEIGRYAAERIDRLVAVGPRAAAIAEAARPRLGERAAHVDNVVAAAQAVLRAQSADDVVLVKASRGMQLEQVIDALGGTKGRA